MKMKGKGEENPPFLLWCSSETPKQKINKISDACTKAITGIMSLSVEDVGYPAHVHKPKFLQRYSSL